MGDGSGGVLTGNSVERRNSGSYGEPKLYGFQVIRSSRTVGTDEGRVLPSVRTPKKNGEVERTSRKERAVRSRDAHCAPLAQRPFMRSSSWNHRERRVRNKKADSDQLRAPIAKMAKEVMCRDPDLRSYVLLRSGPEQCSRSLQRTSIGPLVPWTLLNLVPRRRWVL